MFLLTFLSATDRASVFKVSVTVFLFFHRLLIVVND